MSPSEIQHRGAEKHVEIYVASGPRIGKVRRYFAALPKGAKVLDVGCATGAILAPLANHLDLHGVDISEGLIAKAVQSGVKGVVHDVETQPLPYPDKTFDAIFCGEVIEHHIDTDWLLSQMNRVLKPGGIMALTFPNVRTLLSLGMMLCFDMPPMYSARYRAPHYRDFTLRTIKIAFRNHGLEIQKAIGCSFYLPKLGEFAGVLAGPFPSWANTTLVLAVKTKDSVYSAEETMGEIY